MSRRSIPTIIVGPTTLLREALSRMLAPRGFRTVSTMPSLAEADFGTLAQADPCLLVMELGGSPRSEIAHIARFKEQSPHGRIALVGRRCPLADIAAAFQAGANAYFSETTAGEEFLKAIELIVLGHQTLLPFELLSEFSGARPQTPQVEFETTQIAPSALFSVDKRSLTQPKIFHLSPRESGILRCLLRGASNKVIAREINISEATVKVHVKAILRKIGASNRTQAAIWAMTNPSLVEVPQFGRMTLPPPRSTSTPVENAENL
jgi:two-component system, NarL family, nitrate/nitrite response regulator NarL